MGWVTPKSIADIVKVGKSFFSGLPIGVVGGDAFNAIIDEGMRLVEGFANLAGFKIDLPKRDVGYDPTQPIQTMANGGILNEPVRGIGQNTGRGYLMGERGSEAVVPLNNNKGIGSSTVVNININNMSGDRQDVEKLRKTILEVLQQTSTNRVRA